MNRILTKKIKQSLQKCTRKINNEEWRKGLFWVLSPPSPLMSDKNHHFLFIYPWNIFMSDSLIYLSIYYLLTLNYFELVSTTMIKWQGPNLLSKLKQFKIQKKYVKCFLILKDKQDGTLLLREKQKANWTICWPQLSN